MKTWIMTTSIPKKMWLLLADGTGVETCNAMAAGATKKAVIATFKAHGIECSPYLLKEYGSEVTDVYPYNRMAIEGAVQVQRLNANDAPWFRVRSLEETADYEAEQRDQVRCEQGALDIAAGERDRREQDARELADEIVGYPV